VLGLDAGQRLKKLKHATSTQGHFMGIEYFGTPKPHLDFWTINRLLDQLSRLDGLVCVRRGDLELGLARTNDAPEEMLTIYLATNKVHLLFHAAHGDERNRVLRQTHVLLSEQGIECDLEEE
jgi:hypothetical protein